MKRDKQSRLEHLEREADGLSDRAVSPFDDDWVRPWHDWPSFVDYLSTSPGGLTMECLIYATALTEEANAPRGERIGLEQRVAAIRQRLALDDAEDNEPAQC
jgi:hypothetical protein